ncbi:MAG: restriction endonuclease subunit S [Prevotellaceae bacterium]|jgi:restriction endonuclease S subunit|nr:restriction endonuclease subunit S [Prevotellaceae bacterium]
MKENNINISAMLHGRFDFAINLYNQTINHFRFPTYKLSDLLLTNPQYGANESGIERKSCAEPRYIRITDIDEFGILNSAIGVTAANIEEKYFLENNDIIIARSGATVGKSYIHKKDKFDYICFFAGYMIRFKVNPELILPDFLFIYTQLNPYKQWISAIQRTTGQPNINAEEYKSLKIPLPPKEIQQQIVDLYNHAVKEKQAKEQEAKALLDSIDNYLLKELWIELPENIRNERYFEVNVAELIGGRYDTIYYKDVYRRTLYVTEKFKTKLGNYITTINYGASVSNSYVECGIPFLRIKDLLPNEIKKNDIVFLPEEMKEQLLTSLVKKDDFLISRSGTIGVTAIVDEEFDNYAFGSFMIRFSTKNIDRDFLSYYINSTIGKLYFERNKIGAIQGNITIPTIKNLPIPDISIEKQSKISKYIQSVQTKAKQLQQEAMDTLEKAKREVERMIENG